ncbi:hypothetical protein D3C83_267730 [compost metagenome]
MVLNLQVPFELLLDKQAMLQVVQAGQQRNFVVFTGYCDEVVLLAGAIVASGAAGLSAVELQDVGRQ